MLFYEYAISKTKHDQWHAGSMLIRMIHVRLLCHFILSFAVFPAFVFSLLHLVEKRTVKDRMKGEKGIGRNITHTRLCDVMWHTKLAHSCQCHYNDKSNGQANRVENKVKFILCSMTLLTSVAQQIWHFYVHSTPSCHGSDMAWRHCWTPVVLCRYGVSETSGTACIYMPI